MKFLYKKSPYSFHQILSPDRLQNLIDLYRNDNEDIVLLCIGTDRMIGDSLGPIVGSLLRQSFPGTHPFHIYGTLQNTVHAQNLPEVIHLLQSKHANSLIIAIDASFGSPEDIGSVFIREGTLQPGAGVNKRLPALGDISITGIAAEESRYPYLTLQTVRLSVIMQMAETICRCIRSVQI